jgi:uncharacterized protein
MSEEQPLGAEPVAPEPQPAPAAAPARYPFWSYGDLAVFAGLFFPCLFLGVWLVKAISGLFSIHIDARAAVPLAAQFTGYLFWFGVLWLILKIHDEPFWRSLGWKSFRMQPMLVVLLGVLSAYGVSILGRLIQTPETPNPMTELMEGRLSLILMAIFGITFGPLCEELAFRGFLQPLLVRSLGAAPGVVVAAIPFGLLHYREYGNSWRHAVIVAAAGAAFGWVRHITGSTRASTIMHGAYNSLFFVAFLARGK